ncbi:MAG: acyl-CoA dehydrogenase family protein [Novosphingobium sp.]
MDFNLTPEQEALADSVARFTARDYTFDTRNRLIEAGTGLDRGHWQAFADLGWLGAGLSEQVGGYGGGPVENMIIMEGFGRALVLEPFLPVAVVAVQTLAALAPSTMRDTLIAEIVAGQTILILAHGELAARGMPDHVETRMENGRITGAKSMVIGGHAASRLIVSACGADGLGLYLVDPAAAGISARHYRLLDNQHAVDLVFEDTPVLEALAGPVESEAAIAAGLAHGLVGVSAEAVGAMDAAIRMTRDYITTRHQFGTALSTFQALQHRMADMLVEMELSRSILYQGIASLGHAGSQRTRAVAAMKAIVSSAALFVGRNAVQLHGGIGMTEEYAVGHFYRRLFVIAGQFGGESLHLKTMAGLSQSFWAAPAAAPSPITA